MNNAETNRLTVENPHPNGLRESDSSEQKSSEDPSCEPSELIIAVEQYVAALESGHAEPIEVYAARFPELGSELLEYLKGVSVIHAAVESARDRNSSVSGQGRLDAAPSSKPTLASLDTQTTQHPGGPSADEKTSTKVIGDYEVHREIGRGGMGVVYEAQEQSLQRRVALKVLPFAAVLDQRQITRFRNEAQAAAALHHPNIVQVFAIGQDRGVHYYAMQHIEGQSLAQAIAELKTSEKATASPDETTKPMALEQAGLLTPLIESPVATTLGDNPTAPAFLRSAAKLAADAADALQHAHEAGVVHRDIKPSNLLIDDNGKVWVTDFGLARMQSDLSVTATGDIIGTVRYMSPEQARGQADRVDGRADVYALGATLYELVTLRPVLEGDDRLSMLEQLERCEPEPPTNFNSAIPVDLQNIILKSLEKDPNHRYESAGELRDDLQRFLDGRSTIARPPRTIDRVIKWARRRQRAVAVAAASLAVVSLVSLVSALLVNSARTELASALAESESHRQRAEHLLDQARGVLDRFGSDLSDQLAPVPGTELVRSRALQDTLKYYREFVAESTADPRLGFDCAQTLVRAGAVAERLGQASEAGKLYAEAATKLRDLAEVDPDNLEVTAWLARALTNEGALLASSDATSAKRRLAEAIVIRRDLLGKSPGDPERMADLAAVLSDAAAIAGGDLVKARSQLNEAIGLLQSASELSEDSATLTRRLAIARNALASLLRDINPDVAIAQSSEAVELLSVLVSAEPTVDAYRADYAMALSNRGALAADREEWEAAIDSYSTTVKQLAVLAHRAPLKPRHRSELAVALASEGTALAAAGRFFEAGRAFDQAESALKVLIASYPNENRYQRSLAALWNNRGVVMRDAGRLSEAALSFATAVRLEEERLARNSEATSTHLAIHYANLANVLGRLGKVDEAARVESKRDTLLARVESKQAGMP